MPHTDRQAGEKLGEKLGRSHGVRVMKKIFRFKVIHCSFGVYVFSISQLLALNYLYGLVTYRAIQLLRALHPLTHFTRLNLCLAI